jgi:hypothetical protein
MTSCYRVCRAPVALTLCYRVYLRAALMPCYRVYQRAAPDALLAPLPPLQPLRRGRLASSQPAPGQTPPQSRALCPQR